MPDPTRVDPARTGPSFQFHPRPLLELPDKLVIGHIRWSRSLGLPAGHLSAAFVIRCYRLDREATNAQTDSQEWFLPTDQDVDAWEGRHENDDYRITFISKTSEPTGYGPGDRRKDANYLDVAFSPSMIWETPERPGQTHASIKELRPTRIVFSWNRFLHVLPDIEVVSVPR